MAIEEMLDKMSEENPGARVLLSRLAQRTDGKVKIDICKSLELKGDKLYKIYVKCCDRDFTKFNRTLTAIVEGYISIDDTFKNLDLDQPIPFLDDSIPYEGSHDEYYGDQGESFKERLQKEVGVSL